MQSLSSLRTRPKEHVRYGTLAACMFVHECGILALVGSINHLSFTGLDTLPKESCPATVFSFNLGPSFANQLGGCVISPSRRPFDRQSRRRRLELTNVCAAAEEEEEEMPGKGQRRREKNYRAAHGGESRLPPPPKLRELEALPSKLRRLIAIQNKHNSNANAFASAGGGGAPGKQDNKVGKNKLAKDKKTKKQNLETPVDNNAAEIKDNDGPAADENVKAEGGKGNRKRKQGKAMDLRFKELEENVPVSKKQKRKKHLDEKKRKRKGNKTETLPEFPGREKVKFGEVVQAPPKLSFPKVKRTLDASREMLRKEAIENYRNIKGWTSRPGLQIPALAENTSL